MLYEATDVASMMGIGNYVGEIREGPDGQLYEWVEGVDGLGNPIGFFRRIGRGLRRFGRGIRRFARPFARFALPFARFIPGVGPAIYAGGTLAQRAGLLGMGEIAEGPDGQLYEYVEGYDGVGALGRRRGRRQRRRGEPPPPAEGLDPEGPPEMESLDGQLYEVVEGIGAFGERRRFLRRVSLCIPATIRPRALIRRPVRPGRPAPPAIPGARPPVPASRARAFRRFR